MGGTSFSPGWLSPSWRAQPSLPQEPCCVLASAVARAGASGVSVGPAWLGQTQDMVDSQGASHWAAHTLFPGLLAFILTSCCLPQVRGNKAACDFSWCVFLLGQPWLLWCWRPEAVVPAQLRETHARGPAQPGSAGQPWCSNIYF